MRTASGLAGATLLVTGTTIAFAAGLDLLVFVLLAMAVLVVALKQRADGSPMRSNYGERRAVRASSPSSTRRLIARDGSTPHSFAKRWTADIS